MSYSKPLLPFTYDLLCYLNRDQLERFSIVCRHLKNLIERYFYFKPYRVFDRLEIRGGSYALVHNYDVQWHPNRNDYSVQQFLAGQKCSIGESKDISEYTYYSFAEMHPYFGPTVRMNDTWIFVAGESIYKRDHIAEMESIAYLWRNGDIEILHDDDSFDRIVHSFNRIVAADFQHILNSPTILQCRVLTMRNAHFSFKNYKVLYAVNVIDICYCAGEEIDPSYWTEFLERPGVKPVVSLIYYRHGDNVNVVECLKKAFSSAVVPNAFMIVFPYVEESLTEFRETNKTSRENLELKKGPPTNCESIKGMHFYKDYCYTLERFSI